MIESGLVRIISGIIMTESGLSEDFDCTQALLNFSR